ncbi:MAG: restriction endonuclease subunit S [Sterolibacteriaceae bacterium]|nr:restriction endonuclease subunit S [Sterolibacteriaceae bacterium]
METLDAPANWEILPFELAASRITARTGKIKAGDYQQIGATPVIDQGKDDLAGYTDNSEAEIRSPLPLIVFGDHTRNIKFVDFPFAVGADGVVLLRPDPMLNPKYFYYWMKSLQLFNLGYSRHFKLLQDQQIAFPADAEEQYLIVKRIEAQTSRVEAIRKAQQELADEMRGVLAGYYAEITADADWKPLGAVAPQMRRPVTVQAGQCYPELGIRSFGKGTFHKPAISAEQLGSKRLYHIHPGDLIFNNVFAWEGAVAVVRPEDAGRVGSHRFITCVPKPRVATTPFLYFHFTTEQGLHDLGDASPGGAGRNRTLGLKNLAAIKVPVPDYDKQLVCARLWEKTQEMRRLQDGLAADLNAYVPALLAKAFRGEL